ncbi:MAG: hypothetical protein V4668_00430 [Patescibacteria group bacterium]
MRNIILVYVQLLGFILLFGYFVHLYLKLSTIELVVGMLVLFMLSVLTLWEIIQYHLKKDDKGHH